MLRNFSSFTEESKNILNELLDCYLIIRENTPEVQRMRNDMRSTFNRIVEDLIFEDIYIFEKLKKTFRKYKCNQKEDSQCGLEQLSIRAEKKIGFVTKVMKEHSIRFPTIKGYLDIGCGDGTITEAFISKFSISNAYGADIIKSVKLLGSINYIQLKEDNTSLPFSNNSLNLITAFMSFHHMKNLEHILNEISRIMSKDGLLIIREHDCVDVYNNDKLIVPKEQLKSLIDCQHAFYDVVWSEENIPFFETYYSNFKSRTEWAEIIERKGFKRLTDYPISTYRNSFRSYVDIFIKIS